MCFLEIANGKSRNLGMQHAISKIKLGDYNRRDIYETSTKKHCLNCRPAQRSRSSRCARLWFLDADATITRAIFRRCTYDPYGTMSSESRHLRPSFGVEKHRQKQFVVMLLVRCIDPSNRPWRRTNEKSTTAELCIANTISQKNKFRVRQLPLQTNPL